MSCRICGARDEQPHRPYCTLAEKASTTPNFGAYKDEVARVREIARRLARQGAPYVKSRGAFLTAGRETGDPIVSSAEAYGWNGTKRELLAFAADVVAKGATWIAIEGGHDSSDDVQWMFGDDSYDYLPWAASWTVEVYKGGWLAAPRGEAANQ